VAEPCPFCAIVAGTEPATVVRRWDDALAIVPHNPVVPGHLLVIPVVHVADAAEDPAVTGMVFARAAELAVPPCNLLAREFALVTSIGAEATQTIKHFHGHIVPRQFGDGLPLPWTPSQEAARAGGLR
jgi:histidine triad (HIT) family protein